MNFVTGSTGIVGIRLVCDLLKKGEQVQALYRSEKKKELFYAVAKFNGLSEKHFAQLQWIQGDVLDFELLDETIKPNHKVFHCAAVVSFDSAHAKWMNEVNITGTANMVNACLDKKGLRFCHVSSTAAIGVYMDGQLIDESCKWIYAKGADYSISKHYSELEVWRGIEEGLHGVIVNPCIILGPGDWNSSSATLFRSVYKGMPFYGLGGNAFVDVGDLTAIMMELVNTGIRGDRFLIVGENMTFRRFFDGVAKAFGKKKPYLKAGASLSALAWRMDWLKSRLLRLPHNLTRYSVASANSEKYYSNEKIKNMLQYEFRPIKESVAETVSFFSQQAKQ